MNSLNEDFLNKNSKPVKNQKAKMKRLKQRQIGKTNNATDQKEMPKANSIGLSEAELDLFESIQEAAKGRKRPIFIVCSFTNTTFGNIVKTVTHATYSHAGLSLTPELSTIYSFNADNKVNKLGGFSIESLNEYNDISNKCQICVSCIFVKQKDYDIIKKELDLLLMNQKDTTYAYGNILNILLSKYKEMSANAMSLVCSQFVSYILNKADIKLMDKPINLTQPEDLARLNNPRVYKLYEGMGSNYKPDEIKKKFKKLRIKAEVIKEQFRESL